jgi:VWFA-related protein
MRLPLLVCFASLALAQTPTFQAGTSQVRVDVEVFSGSAVVAGLRPADFLVRDSGRTQPVLHVTQNEEPIDLILLFDISGSMEKTVARVAASARQALAQLRPGDRVAVMTFASRPRLLSGFTDDFEAIERTIQDDILDEPFEGGTRLWDAADESARIHFRQGRNARRRAVIMITDNLGQKGRRDEDESLESLWESSTVLCAVVVNNPEFARRERRAIHIDRLAAESGGDVIESDDAGEAFGRMVSRIRGRYSIYYEMPQGRPGEFRKIEVSLQGDAQRHFPGARVRARKAYRVPN